MGNCNLCELRKKDVINVCDGTVLGCITDLVICLPEGRIQSIVVPGCSKGFDLFKSKDEMVIPWCRICKIGDDVILVELENKGKQLKK